MITILNKLFKTASPELADDILRMQCKVDEFMLDKKEIPNDLYKSIIHAQFDEAQKYRYRLKQAHKVLAGEGVSKHSYWFCAEDFFVHQCGRVIIDDLSLHEGDKGEFSTTQYRKIHIGDDIFELKVERSHCRELTSDFEEWKKNGVLHRGGGHPARICYTKHYVPDNAHLDRSSKQYYIDGAIQHVPSPSEESSENAKDSSDDIQNSYDDILF